MPTYEYHCKNCGHQMEELQSFTDPPLVRCPKCHKDTLARAIGGGGGLIFKGSGFYLTDYKKSGGHGKAQPGKKKEEKKSDSPSPAKPPESKSSGESKPPLPKQD
jgi:putative FmdB family regulatory protein